MFFPFKTIIREGNTFRIFGTLAKLGWEPLNYTIKCFIWINFKYLMFYQVVIAFSIHIMIMFLLFWLKIRPNVVLQALFMIVWKLLYNLQHECICGPHMWMVRYSSCFFVKENELWTRVVIRVFSVYVDEKCKANLNDELFVKLTEWRQRRRMTSEQKFAYGTIMNGTVFRFQHWSGFSFQMDGLVGWGKLFIVKFERRANTGDVDNIVNLFL